MTGLLIVFLIEVILFIFSEYLLMFVVGTLYFFAIALASCVDFLVPESCHESNQVTVA